ncbi:MAG: hypothetical protein AAFX85_06680, partial [Pseudomonadota bacterium]
VDLRTPESVIRKQLHALDIRQAVYQFDDAIKVLTTHVVFWNDRTANQDLRTLVMQLLQIGADQLIRPTGESRVKLIDVSESARILMPAADLARHLAGVDEGAADASPTDDDVDLLQIPADRRDAGGVLLQANLQEAWERLNEANVEALYIEAVTAPGIRRVYGVLTRTMIERVYLPTV